MAYTSTQLTTAFTNVGPGVAPSQAQQLAIQAIANQNASGVLTDAQALQQVTALSANSTTSVDVGAYQFFTGVAPSVAGLTALNAAYTGNGVQAGLNQENRFIAQSVSLATQNATAKAAFAASYGSLTIAQATAAAYNVIIGNSAAAAAGVDVNAAVAYLSSTASVAYYTAFIKANTSLTAAADIDLAVKAAIVGEILNIATSYNNGQGLGSYATATNNLIRDLADDGHLVADNAAGIDLFANYGGSNNGSAKILGNGTDVLTGNVFTALPVYTPGGEDRINSLQDDDSLTGTGVNPTLNVTLVGTNDSSPAVITPKMKGVQTINVEVTGNANTLDLRNSSGITTLNVNRITSAGTGFTAQNISDPASNLSVRDTSSVFVPVAFRYVDGVLVGTRAGGNSETGNLALNNVSLSTLSIGNTGNTQGFETVLLASTGTNTVRTFNAIDLETLKVTGSGTLNIVNTTVGNESTTFTGNSINIGDGIGVRAIDLSAFTGTSNIDISGQVGVKNDPANSGAPFAATITGGTGSDTFWVNQNIGGTTATLPVIDGGTGTDTIRAYADITKFVTVKNVEALDLRNQSGTAQTVDLTGFDASLSALSLRWENAAAVATNFTVTNISKALAESGNIVLRHPTTGVTSNTVALSLATATATTDLISVAVVNDLNTTTTFDYTLNLGGATAATKIENVKIADNDTESNKVTLTQAASHTGTVTLTGGVATQTYAVLSTLVATTVDASAQASDLSLIVGKADQTIKLGTGSDTLTFDGVDLFTGADTVTDAGGTDTLRAAFSQSVTGAPTLNGIEKLHIVATDNVTIDAANIKGVTELAILSDKAVDGASEIFTAGLTSVDTSDVITLKNTTLDTINFFGDADGTAADGGDVNTVKDSGAYTQTFNGLTLENNTGSTVKVNIAAPLSNGADSLSTGDGIKAYNLGKLTTHGVQTLNVVVANEYSANGTTVTATDAVTTIGNIYDKNLVTFTAEAKGSLALGVVSGNDVGNNIKTFDVSKVGGNFSADVVALGDNAVVTLAAGINTFNALGSSGNGVSITSFAGADVITGTSQNDVIDSGAGNDTVNGDRGNNVIRVGAGDDIVTAKDGNNTISFGTGTFEAATINDTTGLDGSKSTNVFTLEGSTAIVKIDSDGIAGFEVNQAIAVGAGSALRVEWTGAVLNESNALLDGGKAVINAAATYNGDGSSNLVLADTGEATTFNGGAGNDVLILKSGVVNNITFAGGDGNDTFVGSNGGDDLTGGKGADVLVLTNTGLAADNAAITTIHIADGDSTAAAWDLVYGFKADTAAAFGTDLDLASAVIAPAGFVNGANVSGVQNHTVDAAGFVTFDTDDTTGFTAVTVGTAATGQISLSSALAYLASSLNGTGQTVAFGYDRDGNGTIDDTIVFQDGASDTVVQLVGLNTATAISGTAAANTIHIV